MGEKAPRGTLYVVVCAAPPAAHVQDLVKLAQAAGWEVAVTATPEALAFIDAPLLEAITGFPVRHRWREPDEPESVPEANAIVVAPATFNTINRWVAGITNTVAVGTLCESLGLDAPIVAVPNVNPPLARHPLRTPRHGNFALSPGPPIPGGVFQNRRMIRFVRCKEVTAKDSIPPSLSELRSGDCAFGSGG